MEGTHPLKKSPSQTKLGNFTPDSSSDQAGGESSTMMSNKMTSSSAASSTIHQTFDTQIPGMEGAEGSGMVDKSFETLYQFDSSILTRPMSAFETGTGLYPKGKLFDPILEILQADESLKRASQEILQTESDKAGISSYEDIEKVVEEMDKDFKNSNLTTQEARGIAEEIISDMEEDLLQVAKFRGMMPTDKNPLTTADAMDRFYI